MKSVSQIPIVWQTSLFITIFFLKNFKECLNVCENNQRLFKLPYIPAIYIVLQRVHAV
jgi:hypothetical protein